MQMPACYGYTWDSLIYPYALEVFPNEVASRYQLLFDLKMTSFKPLMLLSFCLYFHYWVPYLSLFTFPHNNIVCHHHKPSSSDCLVCWSR